MWICKALSERLLFVWLDMTGPRGDAAMVFAISYGGPNRCFLIGWDQARRPFSRRRKRRHRNFRRRNRAPPIRSWRDGWKDGPDHAGCYSLHREADRKYIPFPANLGCKLLIFAYRPILLRKKRCWLFCCEHLTRSLFEHTDPSSRSSSSTWLANSKPVLLTSSWTTCAISSAMIMDPFTFDKPALRTLAVSLAEQRFCPLSRSKKSSHCSLHGATSTWTSMTLKCPTQKSTRCSTQSASPSSTCSASRAGCYWKLVPNHFWNSCRFIASSTRIWIRSR